MVVWNGETFYYKTLGIQPSEIIDTTAAGDSFCGGLIFIFSLYDSLRHRFITKLLFFRRCHLETFSLLMLYSYLYSIGGDDVSYWHLDL